MEIDNEIVKRWQYLRSVLCVLNTHHSFLNDECVHLVSIDCENDDIFHQTDHHLFAAVLLINK